MKIPVQKNGGQQCASHCGLVPRDIRPEGRVSLPVSALYITTDTRSSYTISWSRKLLEVKLDGVEFKSLPSGLHSVKEDLVYFIHGEHAGVSAFVLEESDAQHRNASFAAVGALVPLSSGRLGRAWLHAASLRELAKSVVQNVEDTGLLEQFWVERKLEDGGTAGASRSPTTRDSIPTGQGQKRKRGRSDASVAPFSEPHVSQDHPALSIPALLDTFGPLVFPLHRAALLRKRILLLGSPPVQRSCHWVYEFSVLASIPHSLDDLLQPDSDAIFRIQPLFSIGIHDIPFLSEPKEIGWLACTTDDILKEKHQLYDYLVELPSRASKRWPAIRSSAGTNLKATQRDLRRYRLLRAELGCMRLARHRYRDDPSHATAALDPDDVPLIRRSSTILSEVKQSVPEDPEVVEPVSWTAMAYNGIMWWASAGEMQAWEDEEARADQALFDDLPEIESLLLNPASDDAEEDIHKRLHEAQAIATMVVAYFHHLTSTLR